MTEMTQAFLTSDSQTWATPWPFIESLKPEWDFGLDVCAMETSRKALLYYDEAADAFKQDWAKDAAGYDAWCNPPYGEYLGKTVGDWAELCWKWRKSVNSCMLLPINKQDQDWFHDLVIPDGEEIPVRGRIAFVDPVTGLPPRVWKVNEKTGKGTWVTSGNSQGSMLIAFGPRYTWEAIQARPEGARRRSHDWRKFRANMRKTAPVPEGVAP